MTDASISPLRRRMIEDMTVRNFVPKTQSDYIRAVQNLAGFLGQSPDTASHEDLRLFQLHLTEDRVGARTINSHGLGAAVLLRRNARSGRCGATSDVCARAAQAAAGVEPRGGCAASGGRPRHQVQGRAQRRLWCGPAGIRSRRAQGVRHRQQAHDAPGRAGQGPQGSPRDALPAAARVSARLVARARGQRLGCSPDRTRSIP